MGNIIRGNDGDTVEITLRDYSGGKIESRRCPAKDEKSIDSIFTWLKEKYGKGTGKKEDIDFLSPDSEFLKW